MQLTPNHVRWGRRFPPPGTWSASTREPRRMLEDRRAFILPVERPGMHLERWQVHGPAPAIFGAQDQIVETQNNISLGALALADVRDHCCGDDTECREDARRWIMAYNTGSCPTIRRGVLHGPDYRHLVDGLTYVCEQEPRLKSAPCWRNSRGGRVATTKAPRYTELYGAVHHRDALLFLGSSSCFAGASTPASSISDCHGHLHPCGLGFLGVWLRTFIPR